MKKIMFGLLVLISATSFAQTIIVKDSIKARGGFTLNKVKVTSISKDTLANDSTALVTASAVINYVATIIICDTATLDFNSTSPGDEEQQSFPVIGAAVGDPVTLGVPAGSTGPGIVYDAWVSEPDMVNVRFRNVAAVGDINPDPGLFKVCVFK